ncbi:hypothetical protein BI364_02085 [Acidihalobacter yilgarnensis]|uniref:Uncharacterized protein n=1 Tax=Acidihalobacter yilgarnensis TaxID=2819280 RepID=A0A1D8IKJ0_9GAMM|nr:hypothetical protein BI364_02085 [Acidihalobacter yilgarnensis]
MRVVGSTLEPQMLPMMEPLSPREANRQAVSSICPFVRKRHTIGRIVEIFDGYILMVVDQSEYWLNA